MRLGELPDLDEFTLTINVLQALNLLMQLDQEFPDQFNGQSSVTLLVGMFQGFEAMETLALSHAANEEIVEKAQ